MTGVARTHSGEHLGIVELAEVCARFRAASLDLFARLGAWVVETEDPGRQRLFAEAAHRHAWHADLWLARSPTIPTIPTVDVERLTGEHRAVSEDRPPDPAGWYRARLDELIIELETIDVRIDPMLDPSTHRAIHLVSADLHDLRTRLDN